MALPIISGIVEGLKNNLSGNNQTQQNQQAAAAVITQAAAKQNNNPITSGEKTYTEVVRENREQSKKNQNQSDTNWRNSAAGVDISLGKATTDQKLEAIEQGATPENVGLESPKTSSSSGNLSKWQNPNVDWETPKDTIIENPTPAVNDGGVFNNPVDLIGTVAGIGVGAKVATTVAPKIISKVPDIAKDLGKTTAGFTIGGGLAGTGGETEFSKETSKISGELKELSSDYIAKADSMPAKIGANIGALGLGAAAAAVDTLGALSSARAGAIKIADQIGEVPENLWELMNGNGKASDIPETMFKPVITFGEGVKTAGQGIADWAMNAGNTPAFSLGEALGFGGVFKGTKTAVKLPETAKNTLIKEAQADITGSFSEFAGLDRTATEKAFKAASNTVQLAQKVDVPLVSKTNVPLQDLTMFEDINPKTLGKLETSLANAEVVSYGTTANVLFGLDFRKTSDFDASVPEKNAVKLVNQILEDTKAYGTRPSKPITNDATSYQIERPSPQTGKYAHMFDLKKLEEDIGFEQQDYTTSVFARTPTRQSQYLKIEPEGAKGAIKVEPLEFALSRKYAAVYFPRTDKLADNTFNFVAPKTISYKTKIDLKSYKTGIVTDADLVTRNVPITGAGFKVARVAGVPGSIAAKLTKQNPDALGTINKKINYPIELGDTHRMKDALDLVGITWEYQNKLAKRGTINPIKGALVSRKFGKNLDTMLKDDYLKAQVRTGAKDKLSDLSPEFATFLKSKGILTDRQLNRVTATPKAKAVETAFLSGSPDIEKIKLQFSPITPGAKAKSSPITPMTTPVKIPQVTTAPSPFTTQPKPRPQKGGTKPAYSTGQSSKRYPFDSTPKPATRNPTITGLKQTGRTSQKNVVSLYYPGDDFLKFGTESPNKKRSDEDSDRRKEDKDFFRAIKTQRIDHFGIYDPLEFLGKGSMTKRSRPELTNFKRTIYEVDGGYQTRKPKGRTRR